MPTNVTQSIQTDYHSKIALITTWLNKNSALLAQSAKSEIVINLAGLSLKGKITIFPETS